MFNSFFFLFFSFLLLLLLNSEELDDVPDKEKHPSSNNELTEDMQQGFRAAATSPSSKHEDQPFTLEPEFEKSDPAPPFIDAFHTTRRGVSFGGAY